MQTSTLGLWAWGPPVPVWPVKFCFWDYWTTAAWETTFVGKSAIYGAVCDGESGWALAALAKGAIGANTGIQAMMKGVAWTPVTITPVLCQLRAGQVIYTVRLEAPTSAMAKFRTSSGTQMMKSVFHLANVRNLRLPGTSTEPLYIGLVGG